MGGMHLPQRGGVQPNTPFSCQPLSNECLLPGGGGLPGLPGMGGGGGMGGLPGLGGMKPGRNKDKKHKKKKNKKKVCHKTRLHSQFCLRRNSPVCKFCLVH